VANSELGKHGGGPGMFSFGRKKQEGNSEKRIWGHRPTCLQPNTLRHRPTHRAGDAVPWPALWNCLYIFSSILRK
jgi:hypothetical protein